MARTSDAGLGTPELAAPVPWVRIPEVQRQHDLLFHNDVMAASPAYQVRHCLMHLDKILGAFASLVEKDFHGEDVAAEESRFVTERLPDLVVFAAKLTLLSEAQWPTPAQSSPTKPGVDRLEDLLCSFEAAVFKLGAVRRPLMESPLSRKIQDQIAEGVQNLLEVTGAIAEYYAIELKGSYADRLREVEARKLK